jgi:putative ABC transport system permease protein
MWKVLLSEFWNDLGHQKTRVFLTTFAIAWGTATVVLLLALGEGLKQRVLSELVSSFDKAISVRGGFTGEAFEGFGPGRIIRFTEDDLKVIPNRVQGIAAFSPIYSRSGVTKTVGRTRVRRGGVEGIYPDYGRLRRVTPAPGGRFINSRDLEGNRRVVFLGDSLAAQLFPEGNALGNSVLLRNQLFTVVGVEESRPEAGPESILERFRAVIPASTFMAVFGVRTVSHIMIRPKDPDAKERLEGDLRAFLGARHRFDPQDRRALWFTDYEEEARLAWKILTGIQVFMGMIGGLTLLAAGAGVANFMFVAVHDRTMEIGVRKAVGARRVHILAHFIFEALILSLAGGLVGLAAGAAGTWLIGKIPTEHEILIYLVHPQISWPIGIATALILALIGLVAGVFPARRAATMYPVEALRYE